MAEKPNLLNLKWPESSVVGPFLRYNNYNTQTHVYTASVMIVLHPKIRVDPSTLRLIYGPADSKVEAPGIHLDTYKEWTFWRFNLTIQLTENPQTIEYVVPYAGYAEQPKSFSFLVPSNSQPWRWLFYSCNGFHGEYKRDALQGIQPLWSDFFEQHKAKPFHVQVGGGDQIYNDPVWDGNCPSLNNWRSQPKEKMQADAFTEAMQTEVLFFYFAHYCRHFSEPVFCDALATVPYTYTWDDHDIFDGWGSYPGYLQHCPVFQGIYGIAKRFYLLFQQHASEPLVRGLNDAFGKEGFSELKLLGASTAVWVLDNRTERTRDQIASQETYMMAKQRITQLPASVRHLVVVTTVPIVWPKIPLTEELMGSMSGKSKTGMVWGLLNKTGIASKMQMLSAFDEPNLLDDLLDHWTAAGHQAEKKQMVKMMQELAKAKQLRVSFISGDVHIAAVGRFYSYPKKADEDFREDYRFMPNITSSAMGNEAPPANLLTTYEWVNYSQDLALGPTREKMVKRFRGGSKKFHNQRNYCTVDEAPFDPASTDINNGCLNFTIRAEDNRVKDRLKVDIWENFVPILTSVTDKWVD